MVVNIYYFDLKIKTSKMCMVSKFVFCHVHISVQLDQETTLSLSSDKVCHFWNFETCFIVCNSNHQKLIDRQNIYWVSFNIGIDLGDIVYLAVELA